VVSFWQRTLAGVAAAILAALLAWMIWGPLPGLAMFGALLLLLLFHHLRNLGRLYRWVEAPDPQHPPETTGVWDDLFARLYRLTRAHVRSRQELSEALNRFREAAAALPDGVIILDDDDRIQWCNPNAEGHFGLDRLRDVGQHVTNLVRDPRFVDYLNEHSYGEPIVLRLEREVPLTASVQLVPFGENQKLLISRDITSIERADTMRRDFVANVSHELRTPLTVVGGFLETLADAQENDPELLRRSLDLMRHQTARMQRLVEDLLTLSQLESSQKLLREEKVEVPELMRILYGEAQSISAGRHRIGLELKSDDWLLGNGHELRSAFTNLVSNAVRYTPEGGRIDLIWEVKGGQPVFSVRDTGIGVEPHHVPRLTERFYRVDRGRSRETGGTGLGLAIVKHVVSRHQAVLEVQSEIGKGSVFSVRFPDARRLPAPRVGRAGRVA
jgi:two-component system phosphate regulon sensor histidine kinase PhoR